MSCSFKLLDHIPMIRAADSTIFEPTPLLSSDPNSPTPSTLPSNCYVQKGQIFEGGWKNGMLRFFLSSYASAQDKKVSDVFIRFFSAFLNKEPSHAERKKASVMLSLAEQHIARGARWFIPRAVSLCAFELRESSRDSTIGEGTCIKEIQVLSPIVESRGFDALKCTQPNRAWYNSQTQDTCRLEHYTLLVRATLHLFKGRESYEALLQKCCAHNSAFLRKWTKLGFDKEAFWGCPDLVDFVFNAHLHRHITHPYYQHTIQMLFAPVRKGGKIRVEKQPFLLVDGRLTSWYEIRKRIKIDEEGRLYSMENGNKKYWMYLDKGLTQWDKNNFENPRHLRKLEHPPLRSRVEIMTTHAHKEDWHLGDRCLQGTRHSFFRIVPGAGFSQRNPGTSLENGAVYSFGWGAKWRDFSFFGPLSTFQGKWFCPDNFEFLKEDLCITPMEVTDSQLNNLVNIVKRRKKEDHPFHIITANCCGITADVLKEAGIIDLCTKNHTTYLIYKLLLPKGVRKLIGKVSSFFERITPELLRSGLCRISNFVSSVILAPIFSLLGAWKTNISYEEEDESALGRDVLRARASNRIKALFSNFVDFFRSSKMEFDMTKNVFKWQKKQPQSYFEKRK
jgi:hypothetical protein